MSNKLIACKSLRKIESYIDGSGILSNADSAIWTNPITAHIHSNDVLFYIVGILLSGFRAVRRFDDASVTPEHNVTEGELMALV